MSTANRMLREIEDIDRLLQRLVREIDGGRANMTDMRRALASIRGNNLAELDRLARRARHELND